MRQRPGNWGDWNRAAPSRDSAQPQSAETAQAVTERYGIYKFCKAMRTFKDAMQAVAN